MAGTGALLGIIAVCIVVGRSRTMRALLAALVVTGVLIVAFSRLYLGLHWLTDVVGGALLAALFVILADVALRMRRRPVWPRRRPSRDQPRAQGVDQPTFAEVVGRQGGGILSLRAK